MLTARNALGVETTATSPSSSTGRSPASRSCRRSSRRTATAGTTRRFRFTLNGPARAVLTVRRGKRTSGRSSPVSSRPGRRRSSGTDGSGAGSASTSSARPPRDARRARPSRTRSRSRRTRTGPRASVRLEAEAPALDQRAGDITAVFDGSRTVTKRRLKPGRFPIQPGGPYTTVRVSRARLRRERRPPAHLPLSEPSRRRRARGARGARRAARRDRPRGRSRRERGRGPSTSAAGPPRAR